MACIVSAGDQLLNDNYMRRTFPINKEKAVAAFIGQLSTLPLQKKTRKLDIEDFFSDLRDRHNIRKSTAFATTELVKRSKCSDLSPSSFR